MEARARPARRVNLDVTLGTARLEHGTTVTVAVPAAGLALLDALDAEVRACHARQLGHLKRAELQTLTTLLRAARAPHEPPDSEWA